jgi:hypothetical protein
VPERSVACCLLMAPRPTALRCRRGGARTWVAVLAAAGVAATQTACGGGDDPHARIDLVPAIDSPANTWEWTSTCRVGPRTPSGCGEAGPHVGTAQLAGNAWNLGQRADATGSVRMSIHQAGTLGIDGHLSSAPPCTDEACIAPEANTWVRGFPSVLYGIDQCNAATSPPQSPHLRLPMQIERIPSSLIGTTTYAAQASEITHTVAYDLWLNPSDTPTPCQTNGTLEVMVWTDHGLASRLPDSMRTANATIPYAVDGAAQSGEDAWSVYVTNVFANGDTAPWGGTIWFVLDPAHSVTTGTISVDLSVVLAAAGGLLRDVFGWSDFAKNYWLDTIAFGIEYGPPGGDVYGAGAIDFALDVSAYCLEVGTTVGAAGC